MRFLMYIFLILASIFGVSDGEEAAIPSPAEPYVEEAAPAPTEPTEPAAGETDGALPDYYEYDTREFDRDCAELMSVLSMWPDSQTVNETYDKLYAEYCCVDALSVSAYLDYAHDVTDSEKLDVYSYAEFVRAECADELCASCHAVLNGPNAESFAEHVGDEAAAYFAAYTDPDSQEQELLAEEQMIVDEYYAALEESEALCRTYQGRSWTMNDLWSVEGDTLYEENIDGYFEVYDGLLEDANNLLGPLYVRLVELRRQIAELAGYESYTDYAYAKLYRRDYGAEEAAAFCRAVSESISGEYYDRVCYEDYRMAWNVEDGAELVDTLGLCAAELGSTVSETWTYMVENGLYDAESGAERMDGGFTVLTAQNTPFLFATLEGDVYDFFTATHEFGHFVYNRTHPMENYLTQSADYDLLECHSCGMEILYSAYYDRIFGDRADTALRAQLSDQLGNLVEGCLYDEFQRRVYAEDDITLDDINRIYCDVCREFGEYEETDRDYYWVCISHNFDSPMYYISYAAGALCALQMWNTGRTDPEAAVTLWREIADADAYSESYSDVMSECGLSAFSDGDTVAAICRPAFDFLES